MFDIILILFIFITFTLCKDMNYYNFSLEVGFYSQPRQPWKLIHTVLFYWALVHSEGVCWQWRRILRFIKFLKKSIKFCFWLTYAHTPDSCSECKKCVNSLSLSHTRACAHTSVCLLVHQLHIIPCLLLSAWCNSL